MTEGRKRHLTLAGLVSAATLLVGSLGLLANGIVDLDRKVGVAGAASDSLFRNDSILFARVERLERARGIKGQQPRPAAVRREGLVRRLFRVLF